MTPDRYEQVSEVFADAIEQPPETRTRYVATTCANDPELRREVLSLLKHHGSCGKGQTEPKHIAKRTRRLPRFGIRWRRGDYPERKPLALFALISASALAAIGFVAQNQVNRIQQEQLDDQLKTVLDANVEAVRLWIGYVTETTERWARHIQVREVAEALREVQHDGMTVEDLMFSNQNTRFLEIVAPVAELPSIRGMHIVSSEAGILASTPVDGRLQAARSKAGMIDTVARAENGETVFLPPYLEHSNVDNVESREKIPVVAVLTPIDDRSGHPIGALVFRWRVDADFTRLFALARMGETGETYAFDEHGTVVSSLRDEKRLRELSVINRKAPPGTAMNVSLRDPGGDLETGFVPGYGRDELPLTWMATQAISGLDGTNLQGYRDFAGRKVVGAWRWLPDQGFGVAAELDYKEAYAGPHAVRNIFVALFLAFTAMAAFAFIHERINVGLRRELYRTREIGPYEITAPIAAGGMGTVYLGSHRLLKRPTAIKVIREDTVGLSSIRRFEHEVRSMSRLSHPNTIQIYDFGLQADGSLYYAMEYLDGLTLQELVDLEGPVNWGRAIYLVKQICGSLVEAHGVNLIHRDLKPGNIMITCLGGEPDMVKILDFGLVMDLDDRDPTDTTPGAVLAGTPAYMAPEQMRTPLLGDTRSDVYSVGCVMCYLITGKPPYEGVNVLDTCFRTLTEGPPDLSPSIPLGVSDLIKHCVSSDIDARPATMATLLESLDAIETGGLWNRSRAADWWATFRDRSRV